MFSWIHSQHQNREERCFKLCSSGIWCQDWIHSWLHSWMWSQNVTVWSRRNHAYMKTTRLILEMRPDRMSCGTWWYFLWLSPWNWGEPIVVASHSGSAWSLWVLATQDSGQTFGLLFVLLNSLLNGTHAPGLGLIFSLRTTKNARPVICLQWMVHHVFSCFNVLGNRSVVVSHETHSYIVTVEKYKLCTCRFLDNFLLCQISTSTFHRKIHAITIDR